LFEQAASISHTAESEIGLTRTFMQRGEYRRALAFVAHTAGAHSDASAGTALYAWLLHLGGQTQIAALTLKRARERTPEDALLAATEAALGAPTSYAPATDLFSPLLTGSAAVPSTARRLASGVLVNHGRSVLTVGDVIEAGHSLWVRQSVGRVSRARLARDFGASGIVELELLAALPAAEDELISAARDPFPGSPAFLMAFIGARNAAPVWPTLRVSFLGSPAMGEARYRLGIDAAGAAQGGPVFDVAGRWIGMSMGDADGTHGLVLASELRRLGAIAHLAAGATDVTRAMPLDEVYERGLRIAVEVLGVTAGD
jgi:hypothetical protein